MFKIVTLGAIACGLGFGIASMIHLWKNQVERLANQAAFVKSALNIIEAQPQAMNLIGSNYVLGTASLNDGFTRIEKLNAKIRIPVKGDNDTALMFCYARRRQDHDKFQLNKLEMTFNKIPGRRLVLLDLGPMEEEVVEQEPKPNRPRSTPKHVNITKFEELMAKKRKVEEAKELLAAENKRQQ